jgi:hypothetical protein
MPPVPAYRLLWPKSRRRMATRRLLIEPSRSRCFDPDEWWSSLVVVERGGLELEWRDGARLTFATGDVLCLQGLELVALRATALVPTLLLIMRR